MKDRVSIFVARLGVSLEIARAMVEPLAGLNDRAFDDHVAYLAEKGFRQESITPPLPTSSPEKTRAEVIDFMSDFLDARNKEQRVASYTPIETVDGVGEQIIEYFADRDAEDEV